MKDFNYFVDKAVKTKSSKEHDCNLTLEVDGKNVTAYSVNVANRDLLFFTDQGTVNYLVDTYGDKSSAVLHDWDFDN